MKMKMPKFLKKKSMILIIVLICIVAVVGLVKEKGKAVDVDVYVVDQGEIIKTIDETAVIKTYQDITIDSLVSAEVKEVKASIGDFVEKGDPLIFMNVEDVEFQIKGLQAQADSLKALLSDAINVEPEKLEQQLSAIRSAEASLDDANRTLSNNEKLFESGALSKDVYESSINDQIIKSEALVSAKQSYELTKKGLSKDLKQKYLSDIDAITYQISQLKNTKDKHAIIAPFSGVITEKFVEVGDLLLPGTQVFEISDMSRLYLETDVLSGDMKLIKEGTKVIIEDEDLGMKTTGTVVKVYPKAFSKISDLGIEQKRVKIEIDLNEKLDSLKLGYEMDIKIVENQVNDGIRIPDSTSFKLNNEWYVFIVNNNKAELRKIQIGVEGTDFYQVLEGLEKGDVVIDSPSNELVEGAAVKYVFDEK